MKWVGVRQALLHQDLDLLLTELRSNPDMLPIAANHLTTAERKSVNTWANRWLRDPANDCLRICGDHRWRVMCEAENLTKTVDTQIIIEYNNSRTRKEESL